MCTSAYGDIVLFAQCFAIDFFESGFHPLSLPDSLCYSLHFDNFFYAKHDFIVHCLPTSINSEAMRLQVKDKGYIDLWTGKKFTKVNM